ncbi:hypothetical protein Tco_0747044 [Tanacetum coccineum]
MNQEVIQQAAREKTWVPKADRVKISTINMRIDPTMTQKEETYQVVLDIIKNTSFYKAFLASADVPRDHMQTFWFTRHQVQEHNFYGLSGLQGFYDKEKEFIVPSSEEELLTFHLNLIKEDLTHLPQIFIDHMHQPWRTLASIINKCLLKKTTSNDRIRQSKVAIIWSMSHKKYVDFEELIWEDFSYHNDNRQLKKSIHEIMHYPRFTKVIINHFFFIHKSVPKALPSGLHTIKDDYVLGRMKFVRIREDFQEYGKAILDTMLTNAIKKSEAYKEFINYSTGLVPPKKTKGKGPQGKKSAKKVSISANDNIIPEPDVALKVGKSISFTEAKEEEVARCVHATHEHLVTESDEPSGVPDESTVILTTSSEGTGTKPGVPDEVSTDDEEEKNDDDRSIDIAETDDDEETYDDFVHGDEYVHDDVDEEMKDAEGTEIGKDDEEINDAKKTKEVKDDNKKGELPPTSSSLSVSSGFGYQFLNLSSDKSLVRIIKDSTNVEINSLLDIQIQQEVPLIQSPTMLNVPVSVIPEQSVPIVPPATTLSPPPSVTNLTPIL